MSFRDQLREARFKAQQDAEAFAEVVFVLERLGCYLSGRPDGLGKAEKFVVALASRSPLFYSVPDACRQVHIPFPQLYDFVREARNSAMHGGAAARYATSHAVELALVLEDALMNGYHKVSDFMVRNVICAEMWQPLSFIRQTMLVNSFSSLPVRARSGGQTAWHIVSDRTVARYLGLRMNGVGPKDLLVQSLEQATTGDEGIQLALARTCLASAAVRDILEKWNGEPVLVTRDGAGELLGILTPYDLL